MRPWSPGYTLRARGKQLINIELSASTSAERSSDLSRLAPQVRGFLDETSLAVVACQKLSLILGNLAEFLFQGFSNASVKRASRLAQQRPLGCVLHERVFKQICRVRRHALSEEQTCRGGRPSDGRRKNKEDGRGPGHVWCV